MNAGNDDAVTVSSRAYEAARAPLTAKEDEFRLEPGALPFWLVPFAVGAAAVGAAAVGAAAVGAAAVGAAAVGVAAGRCRIRRRCRSRRCCRRQAAEAALHSAV